MTGKAKKPERPKRGLKLFFFPKAQGQKHKHKKNKYYVSHKDEWSPTGSIMSGDSPLHNNRTAEAFSFNGDSNQEGRPQLLDSKPVFNADGGRSSPVPTTSKDVAIQSGRPDEKVGDKPGGKSEVLAEPISDKDKEEESHFGSPTLNHSDGEEHGDSEERRSDKKSGEHEGRDKRDRKDDKFRKNGNFDKLDGKWIPAEKKEEKEEEDRVVKCLSFAMTCCECSIM